MTHGYMGDSIVRKTGKTLNRGDDVVVCCQGAQIEHVTEMVEKLLGLTYTEGSNTRHYADRGS